MLGGKIQKKAEQLQYSHEQLSIYDHTISEKYNPIFQRMRETLADKKAEYSDFLNTQLKSNKERVQLEKESLSKL